MLVFRKLTWAGIAGLAAVALLHLSSWHQAAAQEAVTARVLWYGVYTVETTKEVDDPTSPSGKRYQSTPVPPKVNTIQIPGQPLRFGMEYVLSGRGGTNVTITEIYRFPPPGYPDSNTGGLRSTYEQVRQRSIGPSILMGWNLDGATPREIVPGEWIFEVWHGGRKLLDQRFVVLRP